MLEKHYFKTANRQSITLVQAVGCLGLKKTENTAATASSVGYDRESELNID